MPSYYFRLIFLVFIGINLYAVDLKENKTYLMIMQALDYESTHQYEKGAILYEKLYNQTNDYEYLQKAISLYIKLGNYKKIEALAKNYHLLKKEYKIPVMKGYIYALMKRNRLERALQVAKELLKLENTPENYSLIGEIYYNLKQYQFALNYFESSYASKQDIHTLMPMVDILFAYLNQKKKAISYLETYYREHGCSRTVCSKLLIFYQQTNNLDGMISILKIMYEKYSYNYPPKLKKTISKMLISILEKKDINQAIQFLERTQIDDIKLMQLYAQKGEYEKALQFVRNKYKKTKNKELLAQIAILEFEMAKDKQKILPHIIANFKEAISVSRKAPYLNYYGYLLIDYDIDPKKGLELVKEALQKAPNNFAYMDSVAWGYYKLGILDMAFYYMKKVVDNIGTTNEEIKKHWNIIKQSIKNKGQ